MDEFWVSGNFEEFIQNFLAKRYKFLTDFNFCLIWYEKEIRFCLEMVLYLQECSDLNSALILNKIINHFNYSNFTNIGFLFLPEM